METTQIDALFAHARRTVEHSRLLGETVRDTQSRSEEQRLEREHLRFERSDSRRSRRARRSPR